MRPDTRLLAPCVLALAAIGCLDWPQGDPVVREVHRSFDVAAGAIVDVGISGGSIRTSTGPAGKVTVTLEQRVYADTEREVDEILADYDIVVAQEGGTITVKALRKQGVRSRSWRGPSFSTTIEVPADVRLNLGTSGGRIEVRGERSASLDAHTSGGSVAADGGAGALALHTSGGSIEVGRVLSSLVAETSGGSVRVGYVGPAANNINLQTSGGSIHAEVDAVARLEIEAETSGGSVNVRDLDLEETSRQRSQVSGRLNGGGGRFRAHTSGGSVTVTGVRR